MLENLSTRRSFLQRGLTILAAAPTIPVFINQTVMALNNPLNGPATRASKDDTILVVVQLAGGNDGLSTIIPYGDDQYYRLRPAISHNASQVIKLNNYLGLHPNLAPLKAIFDQGDMGIVQGVGYPNPNRSHFRSTDIWESGQPENEVPTSGWVGRYFDNTCVGNDPKVGLAVGQQTPMAMQGERIFPLNFEKAQSFQYNGRDKQHYLQLNEADKPAQPTAPPQLAVSVPTPGAPRRGGKVVLPVLTESTQLDFLHRTALDAQLSSVEIQRITRNYSTTVQYPANDFGNGLRTIAAMITGGMPTRVYYVSLGGFDTHTQQLNRHDTLMTQLAGGLAAFWNDLKQQKAADRVMMMTFSEFGRRVAQNASNGTDHGAAAPMLLLGQKLQQGIIGQHPSLSNLDQGDLKYLVDFRSVYATVLQNWLKTPSKPILGDQFPLLPVVRA